MLLALAAVLAGQRHYVAISDWIHDLDPDARRRFGCPRWGATYKVPSEPTLRRVLQQVDPEAVDTLLNAWLDTETGRVGDVRALCISSRGSPHFQHENFPTDRVGKFSRGFGPTVPS